MNNYDFECFKKEFMLLSELNHVNIVHVFDFKEDDSAVYLIMEHLNGESLTMETENLFKETGSRVFDEDDAKDILVK